MIDIIPEDYEVESVTSKKNCILFLAGILWVDTDQVVPL